MVGTLPFLTPGYGPSRLLEDVVDCITGKIHPAIGGRGVLTLIKLGDIGWTQKRASSKVFDITRNRSDDFLREVGSALNIPESDRARRFGSLVVYRDPEAGYVSIDNRRLAIYHMTLPPSTPVSVQEMTRTEAAGLIAFRLDLGRSEAGNSELTPERAVERRYSSQKLGISINIVRDGTSRIISGDPRPLKTPHMDDDASRRRPPEDPNIDPTFDSRLLLEQNVNLSGVLRRNGVLVFKSDRLDHSRLPALNNTNLNLLSAKGDFLLHISVRNAKQIVINSRYESGGWGAEEIFPIKDVFTSDTPRIAVCDRGSHFQIIMDNRTLHYYKKQIPLDTAAVLYHIGDNQWYSYFSEVMRVQLYYNYEQFEYAHQLPTVADYTLYKEQPQHFLTTLRTGGAVVFYLDLDGSRLPPVSNSNLNLLSVEGDFLLHIAFRNSNEIVLNSRYVSGGWGDEVRIRNTSIFSTRKMTLAVIDRGDYFHILYDGNKTQSHHIYKKRIMKEVTSALHHYVPDQGLSLFREPVKVEFYQDYDEYVVQNNHLAD